MSYIKCFSGTQLKPYKPIDISFIIVFLCRLPSEQATWLVKLTYLNF